MNKIEHYIVILEGNPLIIGSEVEPYAAKTAPFYVGCICVSVNMT